MTQTYKLTISGEAQARVFELIHLSLIFSWARGKILSTWHHSDCPLLAKVFLLDDGRTMSDVEASSSIIILPEAFLQDSPTAVKVNSWELNSSPLNNTCMPTLNLVLNRGGFGFVVL